MQGKQLLKMLVSPSSVYDFTLRGKNWHQKKQILSFVSFKPCYEEIWWIVKPNGRHESVSVHFAPFLKINPSPAEPGWALPLKQCRSRSDGF